MVVVYQYQYNEICRYGTKKKTLTHAVERIKGDPFGAERARQAAREWGSKPNLVTVSN